MILDAKRQTLYANFNMSRHSKWSKIKRQKGMADVAKGKVFTKLAKAITVAAREKGADPSANFSLRMAMDKAREANMPKENIERAIARGTGAQGGEAITEAVYEAYLPGGAAAMIVALTDNKNRTTSNIKHILSLYGGNLGASGSVAWMFEQKAVIRIPLDNLPKGKEEAEIDLIDAGAEDIKEEEGEIVAYINPSLLQMFKENIEKKGYTISTAGLEFAAKNRIGINDPAIKEKLENIFSELDEDEDVNDFFINADI